MAKILKIEMCDRPARCESHLICPHELYDPETGEYTPGDDCPLPDADEYDRALIVRGIEMMRDADCKSLAPVWKTADRLIQEVRDGKH